MYDNRVKESPIRGYTLIELLVVIAIISILSMVVLGNLYVARLNAHDAVRASDIRQISTALEMYYDDHGSFPINQPDNQGWYNSTNSSWQELRALLVPQYISEMPIDPSNGKSEGTMYPTANAGEYEIHTFPYDYIISTYVAMPHGWQTGSNVYGNFLSVMGGSCSKMVDFWNCS